MATTTNFGWQTPDDTDLVKDGAAAIRTLGSAIDTSLVDLKGGTTGQVLSKTSNTDMDFTWVTTDDANAIQNAIVDAKGDLIAASGNDTPARLAVGSNGDTLVADSAATVGLRYSGGVGLANPVINGAFDIWQRGTSVSVAASSGVVYLADRWATNTGANQACTVSRQATGDTTNLPSIQYAMRFQRNSGQTGTGAIYIAQSFETVNSIPFTGKTVTLSFYARKGADYSAASSALGVFLPTGTGTDQNSLSGYTGNANTISSSATLTTTWQRFTYTATVPTTTTEISVFLGFTPTGTAGANDYFEITGVQLDAGQTALPFRRSGGTIQGELAACQRYYWRQTMDENGDFGLGSGSGTTKVYVTIPNPVVMRIEPTSVDYANLRVGDFTNAAIDVTSLTLLTTSGSPKAITLEVNVASGITAYRPYSLRNNSSYSGYVGASAEL